MKKIAAIVVILLSVSSVYGQFAPAAGEAGSTAIYKDDASFRGWAKSCVVTRGFINISDTVKTFTQNPVTSNRAFFGTEALATGKAGGPLDCVSLGDGGTAVLTFDFPIKNGAGPDFAVFENGIREQVPPNLYFLEFAFVEVSTNGKRYVRFPAVSNTLATAQVESFGQTDPAKVHNLAGKYVANYGTPFDLQDLKDSTGINTDSINFIRLIDVVGNIDPKFARYDSKGQVINDPFPTEFWTGGFDLDAVGVIHFNGLISNIDTQQEDPLMVYPNPALSGSEIYLDADGNSEIQLWSQAGKKLANWRISDKGKIPLNLPELVAGLYFISVQTPKINHTLKLLVK